MVTDRARAEQKYKRDLENWKKTGKGPAARPAHPGERRIQLKPPKAKGGETTDGTELASAEYARDVWSWSPTLYVLGLLGAILTALKAAHVYLDTIHSVSATSLLLSLPACVAQLPHNDFPDGEVHARRRPYSCMLTLESPSPSQLHFFDKTSGTWSTVCARPVPASCLLHLLFARAPSLGRKYTLKPACVEGAVGWFVWNRSPPPRTRTRTRTRTPAPTRYCQYAV